jgi:ComF family protein
MIDPNERCPFCFSTEFCPEKKHCATCQNKESYLHCCAAAFDYLGPAASLIRKIKYSNRPHLAEGAAAFLIAQWVELGWPVPDLIVPVPISFTHWLIRGYNQSSLLAEGVAKLLDRPVHSPLKRISGDYSQAGMNLKQRHALKSSTLQLDKQHRLYDQCVLLIDDVMTTGSTLECCAKVLAEGFPSKIYALTFCRAVKQ